MSDLRDKMEGTRLSLLRGDSMLGRSVARTMEPLVDHLQFCLVNLHDRLAALERADDPRASADFDDRAAELMRIVRDGTAARMEALAPEQDLALRVLDPAGDPPPVSPVPYHDASDHRCLQERVLRRTREVVRAQGAAHGGVRLWTCLEEYVLRAMTEHSVASRRPVAPS